MMPGLDQRRSPFRRGLGKILTSQLPPSKHVPRLLYAALCFIAAISVAGCAAPDADLQVVPDGLDFDYTVTSADGDGVVRAFGDQGKTIVVLNQPLPVSLRSVPVELPGGVRAPADVQGNYILVPGRPDRFILSLPSGAVEVSRSRSMATGGQNRSVAPSSASQQGADGGPELVGEGADDSDDVESNLDWGAADGARASSDPTSDQRGPVPGRPGRDGEPSRGPLPTSVEQLR